MDQEKDRKVFDDIHDTVVSIMKISALHNKREEEVIFPEFDKIGMTGIHGRNNEQHKIMKTSFLFIKKETEKAKDI